MRIIIAPAKKRNTAALWSLIKISKPSQIWTTASPLPVPAKTTMCLSAVDKR